MVSGRGVVERRVLRVVGYQADQNKNQQEEKQYANNFLSHNRSIASLPDTAPQMAVGEAISDVSLFDGIRCRCPSDFDDNWDDNGPSCNRKEKVLFQDGLQPGPNAGRPVVGFRPDIFHDFQNHANRIVQQMPGFEFENKSPGENLRSVNHRTGILIQTPSPPPQDHVRTGYGAL